MLSLLADLIWAALRVERARHTVQRVRAHLEEPNHIPADSVAGTRDRLVELESLISKLEEQSYPS